MTKSNLNETVNGFQPSRTQINRWKRFRTKARKQYNDAFDYIAFIPGEFEDSVLIYCKKHDQEFIKRLSDHLKPFHLLSPGCRLCDKEKSHADFVAKAQAVHGTTYTYDKVDYITSRTPVIITCKKHGDFTRTPESHYKGSGCPICTGVTGGWTRDNFQAFCDLNSDGFALLYIIECFKDQESFYKVGITSKSVKHRFQKKMPYKYEELYTIEGRASDIYDLETEIHELLVEFKYTPSICFAGHTECFTVITDIVEDKIKKLLIL